MAKEKLSLNELKVQSFVTTLENEQMSQVKGGYMVVRGRRYSYRTRWTFVDTRADISDSVGGALNNHIGG